MIRTAIARRAASTALAAVALAGTALVSAPPALAISAPSVANAGSSTVAPSAFVQAGQKKHDASLAAKVAELAKSKALMALFDGATEAQKQMTLEGIAGSATMEQIRDSVNKAKGMHFEVTGTATDGHPIVVLLPGDPEPFRVQPRGLNCWQAQVAYWAWFASTEIMCVGAAAGATVASTPLGGGVVGVLCNGVMAGIAQLPNFNAAC